MRLVSAIIALWLFGFSSALAQSEDWLVLPTTDKGETAWMRLTVRRVSSELRKQGIGVWSSAQAAMAFDQRGSSPPPDLLESTVDPWRTRSRGAVRLLARGKYAEALEQLEAAQALSHAALEELNRKPERARTVLDTCLYMVRALLETGDEAEAESQARDCARMVPNTEPTRYMHPPKVAALYAEAMRPDAAHRGGLLIESDPSGCLVRINGVKVGTTPFEETNLHPGSYGVQVECEPSRHGRVHAVAVSGGRTAVFIVDRFDRALRTKPVLHLQYAMPAMQRERTRDARELARTLPAPAVVLGSLSNDDVLELRLITATGKESAFARIESTPSGPEASEVAEGVATLLSGECRDLTGREPVTLDCTTGEPKYLAVSEARKGRGPSRRTPRGQFVAGLTLLSAGTASLLSGYGLLITRGASGDDWIGDPGSLSAHEKWLNVGTGLIVTGSVGGAALVTAMPLTLPYQSKTPWWAWLSGGLGLGLSAGAIAMAVTADPKPDESCSVNNLDPEPCVDRGKRTDLALMLGVTAAPLLTIPLVYLFRRDAKNLSSDLTGIQIGPSGATLTLGGFF